ncbi:hypothetical protein [Aliarcobacter butzleri]|uniref:Uncharacterized protein n=1 Tax=Aliarcobacter butzleri TaxID=28197 RepID=A0AAW6VHE8_9BACT|nr:hypothetical protein [Aliarcobacter butzleri]MDK2042080.1 hypothetical protein [Aliarcobacter butzleri]MDK2097299.1 hypothetical protein [Aliarcobacter butzleri]
MKEIIEFVSVSIMNGVIGNTSYDLLKNILGTSFDNIKSYITNNQNEKFQCELNILLKDKAIVEKIRNLMNNTIIDNSFQGLENSQIDIELGENITIKNSFKDNVNSQVKIR